MQKKPVKTDDSSPDLGRKTEGFQQSWKTSSFNHTVAVGFHMHLRQLSQRNCRYCAKNNLNLGLKTGSDCVLVVCLETNVYRSVGFNRDKLGIREEIQIMFWDSVVA